MQIRLLTILVTSLAVLAPAASFAAKPCAELSGSARTRCLKEEVAAGQAQTDRINDYNRKTDRIISVTCKTRQGAAVAAGAGGFGANPISQAGAAYSVGVAAGDMVTGANKACR